jgi:hypothetical protein
VKQLNKDALLKAASAKLGISDEQLRGMLEKGDSEALVRAIKPKDKEKLSAIMKSKTLMEQLAKDPRTAQLIKDMKDKLG